MQNLIHVQSEQPKPWYDDLRVLGRIFSGIALLLALAHAAWPGLGIDGITLGLLALSATPWLIPLVRLWKNVDLELPGGVKVRLEDFRALEEQAARANLVKPEVAKADDASLPLYLTIAEEDPNLALAGLRIEIERRLVGIAEGAGIDARRRRGIGDLMHQLVRREVLNATEFSILKEMLRLLNAAVHGAKVEPEAADWALSLGPRFLASLDDRVVAKRTTPGAEAG